MTERYVKLVDGVEMEMTPEEITERQAEENAPPSPLPLAQQLDTIFRSLPPEMQADFAALKAAVKLELEQNHLDIASLIIQRATIPEALENARQSLLNAIAATTASPS